MNASPRPSSTIERDCWCGQSQADVIFSMDRLNLPGLGHLRLGCCRGCGVCFLDPQPSAEALGPYYDSPYYGSSEKKFIGPVARFVSLFQQQRARLVARHVRPGGRVLDVGCGNGRFLEQLQQRGFEIAGTELSPQSAMRTPAPVRPHVLVGELAHLSLAEGQFDAVTMWHVLEHVHDPHATCATAGRLLKPGGLLMLSLPNAQSPEARSFGRHWFHLDPPRHLWGLGTRSLPRLLDATGFDVLHVHTWSLEQNPFGFMQSCLNAMGFRRDRAYDTLKGMNKASPIDSVIDVTLLAALLPAAMAWSIALSLAGQGATMTLIARKR